MGGKISGAFFPSRTPRFHRVKSATGLCGLWNLERNDPRDTRPIHCYAMNMIRALHGALVVRDDDELRALLELAHQPGEGGQAEFVQRRVNLVHHAERTRIEQE